MKVEIFNPADLVNFGTVSQPVNALLQQGVAAYRSDPMRADRLFREALAMGPSELPTYLCLYKIHTYQGHLDAAEMIARLGIAEAARQAGWPTDWRRWEPQTPFPEGSGRFALYTLKALSFISLRQQETERASEILQHLARLDPKGLVGWPVVAALAEGLSVPEPMHMEH